MKDVWMRLAFEVLPALALLATLLVVWGYRSWIRMREANNNFWTFRAPRLPGSGL